MKQTAKLISAIFVLLLAFCNAAVAQITLKDAFQQHFLVGVAINRAQFSGQDARGDSIITKQFNSISPENTMKWEVIHPKPDAYDFSGADEYVAFGEKHHMVVIGHTLVWHSQTPAWVFQDAKGNPVTRDVLLRRMHDHIMTVVQRYKGRVHGWDVVNEALDEDGSLRQSPWMKIIGPEYIEEAFRYAHEADPKVELYYNDYSLENPAKRKGALKLIADLKSKGITVSAVGIQGHDHLDWPTAQQEDETISDFESAGVKVCITELDINVLPAPAPAGTADVNLNIASNPKLNPYPKSLPAEIEKKLTKQYIDLFSVFVKHRQTIKRVTFWGVTDADSWLNNWPVRGRTNYPLLFDRGGSPKPAFDAVINTTKKPDSNR